MSVAALLVAVFCHTPTPLRAQTPAPEPAARAPLARFVPASAGVFVNIRDATELDSALQRANTRNLVGLLLGPTSEGKPSPDLRGWFSALVSADHPAVVEGLMHHEIGLACRSWDDLSQGVLLARLPSPKALAEWLPPAERQDVPGPASDMLFRTKGGMMVGVREGVAAFAHRRESSAVLRDALRLIIGGDGDTLDAAPGFRELSGFLPAKPLAVIHMAPAPKEGTDLNWFGWPRLRRVVLGLYGREERLDIALRGLLAKPAPRKALGTAALERFYKLPATTLAAWISAADLRVSYDQVLQNSPDGTLSRYLYLVESLRAATGRDWDSLPALGPHLIVAWDETLDGPSVAPQLAMLVESPQAQTVVAELDEIAESLLPSLDSDETAPRLRSTTHLGTRLRHVPLDAFVGDESLPLAGTLGQLELSWAAQGDWVILSLSLEHLMRVLDAQSGLVPTLSNLSDVQMLRRRGNPASLLVAQPDLAADVLRRWLDRAAAAPDAWFGDRWWSETLAADGAGAQRLGVAARTEQIPGVVVVARVHPQTPAAGKLEPEDWILGMDGQLLDLGAPNADLKRLWAASPTNGRHVLRIIRGDLVQEVALEVPQAPAGWSNLLSRPADALRELAAAARPIRFASWTVHTSDPNQYSALVSLRFGANAPK